MLNQSFRKPCFRPVVLATVFTLFGCLVGASWSFLSAQSTSIKNKPNVPGTSKPKPVVKPGSVPHTGPAPKITDIEPKEPDYSPYVYFGQVMTITGENFSEDRSNDLVVVSPASDINSKEPSVCYTACELAKGLHPFTATKTELKVIAPGNLAAGSRDYCVWVFTPSGGWSNPMNVYFSQQRGVPPSPQKR